MIIIVSSCVYCHSCCSTHSWRIIHIGLMYFCVSIGNGIWFRHWDRFYPSTEHPLRNRVLDFALNQAAKPWLNQYLDPAEGTICGFHCFRKCIGDKPATLHIDGTLYYPLSVSFLGHVLTKSLMWSSLPCGSSHRLRQMFHRIFL